MRNLLDYPLGAVRLAFRTIFGWTAILAVATIGGFVVARSIKEASLAPLYDIPNTIVTLTFNAFFCLPVISAFTVTGLAWSFGMIWESFRFRLIAAVIATVMWAAVATWADSMLW